MKRILMLSLLLVVAFANVERAKAAPFSFGAASFDDQQALLDNLNGLLPAGASGAFMDLGVAVVRAIDPAYVVLMGASQAATANSPGTSFLVSDQSNIIGDSFSMDQYWGSATVPHNLGDLSIGWDSQGMQTASLLDIIDGLVPGVSVSGAFYFGNDLVYQPEGYDALVFAGGTIFIGLDLGMGNSVDAILAFSPAPVNAVPVPAALWLMGTGLAGIVALRKRAN